MTEVRIVLTELVSDDEMLVKACEYVLGNSKEHVGRVLSKDECGEDFDAFVDDVRGSMHHLCYGLVMAHAKFAKEQGRTNAQIFMDLLMELQTKPVEVVLNLLAILLSDCVDEAMDDHEFENSFKTWVETLKSAQEAKE